jgi:hypothetical protein
MPGVVCLAQDRINLCQPLTDGWPGRLYCLNDCYLDLNFLAIDHAEVFVEFDRFAVDFAMQGLRQDSSSCSSSDLVLRCRFFCSASSSLPRRTQIRGGRKLGRD